MADARGVLDPFDRAEALRPVTAAVRADVSNATIVRWCEQHGIGRKIGGRWRVSRIALEIYLSGDMLALATFRAGDRSSELVLPYITAPVELCVQPASSSRENVLSLPAAVAR